MNEKDTSRIKKTRNFLADKSSAAFAEQVETNEKLDDVIGAVKAIPKPEPLNLDKTHKLLEDISTELKKKEQYEYEIEIDAETREALKGADGRTPTAEELVALIQPLIPAPIAGRDADAFDEDAFFTRVLAQRPEQKKQEKITAELVRDLLESLEGDKRLSFSAVTNSTEQETNGKFFVGGTRWLQRLADVSIDKQTFATGDVLEWNATTRKFENKPSSAFSMVTSVFGRTGNILATNGDYTTAQVTESGNLYFTNARAVTAVTGQNISIFNNNAGYITTAGARSAISLTTTGSSGVSTYNSTTGVLNIPNYAGGVTSVSAGDTTVRVSPNTGAVTVKVDLTNANTWTNLQTFGNDISFGGAQLAVSSLTTGNLLQYNGTNWVNVALSSFGVTSVSNSDNTLTISPTTGSVTASLNLANPDTWTGLHTFSITSTATSGQVNAHVISPTYNQVSGNASNTDFLINRIQTAVGSGTQTFIDLQVGGSSKWSVLNTGQQTWGKGLGTITHILGPNDAPLSIASQSQLAAASSLGGQNLNLVASNAVAGLSVSSIATGGAVNITGGNGATRVLSGGNGGAVNIMGGTGSGSGSGISGAVNISGGISIGQSPTGSVNIFTNPNVGGGSSSIGSINITGGSSTTSTGAAGPTPAGAINITSGTGGYGSNTHSSSQGASLTITSGAGGLGGTAGFAFTGAIGGTLSVIGGAGSAAGAGTVIVGGIGANLNFTTGAGGNATGGTTSNTGGAAGNFNIILSNGGTGATANGAPGVFNIQNASGTIQRSTNSFGQVTGQMPVLATVSGINAGTVANTALYTVPAGRIAVVTGIVVRCTAASAVTSGPNIGIGNVAGTNNIFASATLSVLTSTTAIYSFGFAGMSMSTAAAGIIYANLATAFTGTSQTIAIDVMGYLI